MHSPKPEDVAARRKNSRVRSSGRLGEDFLRRSGFGHAPAIEKEDTRSAMSRANCISWVTTIMVMPSFAGWRITPRTSSRTSGSRALVISSHIRPRLHGQGAGDGHALLLSTGELVRVCEGPKSSPKE